MVFFSATLNPVCGFRLDAAWVDREAILPFTKAKAHHRIGRICIFILKASLGSRDNEIPSNPWQG